MTRVYEKDKKGKISTLLYLVGILLSFFYPWMGITFYAVVAAIWFNHYERIEKELKQ